MFIMTDLLENKILSSPRSFEIFFKEKYASLCYIANKYLHDIDAAEELVQDVLVKLWDKREQLEIKGSEMAYIVTSIKNACLNYIKHKKIVLEHEKNEKERLEFDPSESESEMADMELETAVLAAIAELPPQNFFYEPCRRT
jgi:RNA polymerase sigma-70 factor (ECF subfamily)